MIFCLLFLLGLLCGEFLALGLMLAVAFMVWRAPLVVDGELPTKLFLEKE